MSRKHIPVLVLTLILSVFTVFTATPAQAATITVTSKLDTADPGRCLATLLVPFWMATKRLDEGSAWFDRVPALPGGDDAHCGRASFDAGYLAFWKGDNERSSSLQNRALQLGRQTNNPTVTALALVGLARIALRGAVNARKEELNVEDTGCLQEHAQDQVLRARSL